MTTTAHSPNNHMLFLQLVNREYHGAIAQHPPLNGAHEGYAVILEEIDELWGEVKMRHADPMAMLSECVQIAAMASRFASEVAMPRLSDDAKRNINTLATGALENPNACKCASHNSHASH